MGENMFLAEKCLAEKWSVKQSTGDHRPNIQATPIFLPLIFLPPMFLPQTEYRWRPDGLI